MKGKPIGKRYWIAGLLVLTFIIYGRTISYDFVWDDQRSHLNAHEDLMQGNMKALWSGTYDGMYIPVTYTMWSVMKNVGRKGDELNPKTFHFANVLVHAANVSILFLLLHLFFGNAAAAFAGSLLFAFHPLQTESVAWVSEFRGLYSSLFSFLGLYVLFRNLNEKTVTSFSELISTRFFIGATALFVCALLSKPSAVMLPVITLLLTWCFARHAFKPVAYAMIIWICIVIPVALSTAGSQTNEVLSYVPPMGSRFTLAGYSLGFYLTKILAPVKLAPSYGITPQVIATDALSYAFTALVAALAIFVFLNRAKLRVVFTGYFLFIISLIPVTGIVTFYFQRYSNVADRYVYFGMTGMAIIVAYLWTISAKKEYIRYMTGVFIGVCVILTSLQVPVWKNEFSIWDESMNNYPEQYQAAYNRGVYYTQQGNAELAVADYSTALQHDPASKDALVNRANAYARLNRFSDALRDYDAAIAIDPGDGSIYYNRALTNYFMKNFSACPPDILKAQELGFTIDMQFATAVRDSMHRRKNDTLK
jgi:hypothetical protein